MKLMTWSWSQCSFTILKMLGPLGIMINLLCLCSVNETKPEWQRIYLQYGLLPILAPLLRPSAQRKIPFKLSLLIWQCTWLPRALMGYTVKLMSACWFHTCWHSVHSAAHASRRDFNFQVLIFNKYSSQGYNCYRQWFLWWIWAKSIEDLLGRICHSRCH